MKYFHHLYKIRFCPGIGWIVSWSFGCAKVDSLQAGFEYALSDLCFKHELYWSK